MQKNGIVLSPEQREAFDLTCHDAVLTGARTLDEITEKVVELLKRNKDRWAIVQARSIRLKRSVYAALGRCVDRHQLKQGPLREKNVTWEPALVGEKYDKMFSDDPFLEE